MTMEKESFTKNDLVEKGVKLVVSDLRSQARRFGKHLIMDHVYHKMDPVEDGRGNMERSLY